MTCILVYSIFVLYKVILVRHFYDFFAIFIPLIIGVYSAMSIIFYVWTHF